MSKPKPLVSREIAIQTQEFIKALRKCNHGLSRWEIDFLGHLQYHERFSIKQAALIARLRQKVFKLGFFT